MIPALAGLFAAVLAPASPDVPLADAKPVPALQALPLPYEQISLTRDGVERARYHYGPGLRRPFVYPIVGPSGRSLTRMGHPHDPVGHSHHNSVWVAHHDVGGVSFWDDRAPGRVVHRRLLRLDDGDDRAGVAALNAWVGPGDRVLLLERRGVALRPLDGDDTAWLLIIDIQLESEREPVTLGPTPFGLVGVRMAKTIGVHDGGGLIRNSEGNVNEQGPNGAFRKRARWVDYSGPIAPGVAEGIALFDHPTNPDHPSPFHVRADGWMGACLNLDAPLTVEPGRPLRLRYGLFVHGGVPEPDAIEARWAEFARLPLDDLPAD